jgi:protein-disulfide isomerase
MWIRMDSSLRTDDHVRGPTGAELIVVYADFTCPFCALAHARLTELETTGDPPVRRVFRHLALKAKHPRAVALARAAEAAGAQGGFWAFHDAIYADQGHIDDPHLWALAGRLGLDVDRFEQDRRSTVVSDRVQRDTQEAVLAGAMTTPTFFAHGRPDPARYHQLVHTE